MLISPNIPLFLPSKTTVFSSLPFQTRIYLSQQSNAHLEVGRLIVPSVVPTIQLAVLIGSFQAFFMLILIFIQIYQCVNVCLCPKICYNYCCLSLVALNSLRGNAPRCALLYYFTLSNAR
jgi:hypothetical protein